MYDVQYIQIFLGLTLTLVHTQAHCPLGSYLSSQSNECVSCPLNTQSPPASTHITQCLAKAGYYAIPGQLGILCPVGYFCPQSTMYPIPCATSLLNGTYTCGYVSIGNNNISAVQYQPIWNYPQRMLYWSVTTWTVLAVSTFVFLLINKYVCSYKPNLALYHVRHQHTKKINIIIDKYETNSQ